jgi:acyl carrier protein
MSHSGSADIHTLMRRCPEPAQQAARRYRQNRQSDEVPVIVDGVIARYVEQEKLSLLKEPAENLRLVEDLGLDSLSMIEISLTLEDALEVTLSDEKLRDLRTLGDVRSYAVKFLTA